MYWRRPPSQGSLLIFQTQCQNDWGQAHTRHVYSLVPLPVQVQGTCLVHSTLQASPSMIGWDINSTAQHTKHGSHKAMKDKQKSHVHLKTNNTARRTDQQDGVEQIQAPVQKDSRIVLVLHRETSRVDDQTSARYIEFSGSQRIQNIQRLEQLETEEMSLQRSHIGARISSQMPYLVATQARRDTEGKKT